MTEYMYEKLMEHIDYLEDVGFIPAISTMAMRRAIKANEDCAVIVYHFYFG